VLIKLFARCYGWGATNIDSKSAISLQRAHLDPKFQAGRRGRLHQPFFSQKTRLNDFSYIIQIWTDFSSVLSQSTRLTDTDGWTVDRSLIARPRLHSMQRGRNRSIVYIHGVNIFRILNHLGVDHKCDCVTDRQTDGQSDGQSHRTAFSNSAL